MSLTQEDLKAISDLIDIKLDKQEQNINKRFDEVDNALIGEHMQRVVTELSKEIQEIKRATVQNSYDIAGMKHRIS